FSECPAIIDKALNLVLTNTIGRLVMGIIVMIIVGFIVGLIARAIMPGNQNMGIVMTTILGIVGAVLAGYLGQALGWYESGEPVGWIASVVGAIIVLAIVGMVRRKA